MPMPQAERALPSGPPPEQIDIRFSRQRTEQDLLWGAKQRFGEAMVRRALAAPAYIFAKHYAGMLPPPPPDAGPDWKYPEPPVAMLMRENGQWVVATQEGFRLARPDKLVEIEATLRDPAFWSEPEWAPPGCTDAGASLLLARIPGRPEVVRSATCGSTGRSELLVFRSLEA
jgi:hypothetical protein